MEYNSFYGGRRGASFVIVKKYRTIKPPAEDNEGFNKVIRIDMGLEKDAEITSTIRQQWLSEHCMVTCFQQGGDYQVANYDEYVIIDAYNKNDIDNGKIFRRGYDYTNDMGGAIYIGQIVGPAGMAPHTQLDNYDAVQDMTTEDGLVIPNDGTTITDESLNQYRKTSNSLNVQNNDDPESGDLIPGQYYDESGVEQFNDTIDYIACSIRDFESHESTVHIGFKIPYLVNVYTAETVSPYYHRSDLEPEGLTGDEKWEKWDELSETLHGEGTTDFNNLELIKRTDDLAHPFFSKWNISIPKGIKGETLNHFRVTTVEAENGQDIVLQDYEGKEDDSTTDETKKRQILVYDYYNYDRDPSGDPVALYLGDYNMIDNFSIDEYGTVVIDYSHDDRDTYKNLFKWVKEIRLNEETGLFEIEYNYDKTRDGEELAKEDTKLSMYLTWIKDMDVKEDGTVSFTFTTSEDDREYPQFIKWVKSVALNAETGLFEMDFNYETEPEGKENAGQPTHYEMSLTWVKDILIDKYGTVTFKYTDQVDTVHQNLFKWIKEVRLNNETGLFEIEYNYDKTRDGEDLAKEDTYYSTYLRYLKNVVIDEDGTIHLEYTYGEEQTFTRYLKTVKAITLDAETGHFEVIYNQDTDSQGQPTKYETDLRWVKSVDVLEDGTINLDYTHGDDVSYEKYLKSIKTVSLNSETGKFDITFNQETDKNGSPTAYTTNLRWVKEVSIDEFGTITFDYTNGEDTVYTNFFKTIKTISLNNENGHLEIIYNYDNDAEGNPTKYETDLDWIKDLTIAEDGTVTLIHTATGEEVLSEKIKWISDISVNTGTTEGEGTQKIAVTYNDNTNVEIGNPINYIMKTAITNDRHLIVLYSDPVKRQEIITAGQNYTYEDRNDWLDLGVIKGESGIYIGLNISTADVPDLTTVDATIEYLNTTYPNGLTGADLEGKIVTVGDEADYKLFYAFDYSFDDNNQYKGWYYLGSIGSSTGTVVGEEGDPSTEALASQLPTNGIWFIVED